MPAQRIVSELIKIIQQGITESSGEDLSAKEQRALEIGRIAAQMSLSEMLASEDDEPVAIVCECKETAKSKERESRSVVTLAGTQKIVRRKYYCPSCGKWTVPMDVLLGIGKGNYSAGVVALTSEIAAGFPFEASADFLTRRFGLDLCYKQVQRLAERTGSVVARKEYEQAAQVLVESEELGVEQNPSYADRGRRWTEGALGW